MGQQQSSDALMAPGTTADMGVAQLTLDDSTTTQVSGPSLTGSSGNSRAPKTAGTTDAVRATLCLNKLPAELVLEIMSYLGNGDLFNLRVNKKIWSLTTEPLYKHLHVTFTDSMDYRVRHLFSRRNSRLEAVRELTFSAELANEQDGAPYAYEEMMSAIEALPLGGLTHFRFEGHRSAPNLLMQMLWQSQPQLRNIQISPLYQEFKAEAEDANIDLGSEIDRIGFPNLQEVRAVLDCVRAATPVSHALVKGTVNNLEVDLRHWSDERFAPAWPIDATHDPFIETLFGRVERVRLGFPGKFNTLTKLILKDVELEHSAQTWFTFLDLGALRVLDLQHCDNVAMFLGALASRAEIPELTHLTVIHVLNVGSDRTMSMLDFLLCQQQGHVPSLKKLVLCLRNAKTLLKPESLCAHASTLRSLVLDIKDIPPNHNAIGWGSGDTTGGKHLVYSAGDLYNIISSCSNITELALAMPSMSLEYSFLEEVGKFYDHLNLLHQYLDLVTLNIVNFPTEYLEHKENPSLRARDDDTLCRLAEDIFDMYGHEDDRSAGEMPGET